MDDFAQWVQGEAAGRHMTVSGLAAQLLEKTRRSGGYEVARRDFESRGAHRHGRAERYPTRDEIHDRAAVH